MKFQKGILNDIAPKPPIVENTSPPAPSNVEAKIETPPGPAVVVKDRLFETLEEESAGERKYLKVFGVVAVFIVIAGAALWYFMQPGIGDEIRGPKGLEQALRDDFLLKQKRTATDITFYKCDGFTWARVEVELRPDIKTNPVYQIGKYSSRSTVKSDGTWDITAAPITSPEMDVPCK
ncbi:hypothetical protein BH10ACI3_BH10ACI3_16090 [soil metagenome]